MEPIRNRVDRLVQVKRQFLHFLEARTGSREEAEDLLQTAFVKLLDGAAAIRDEEKLVPWFYQILRNLLADRYRRAAAARRLMDGIRSELPPEAADPQEELLGATCTCVREILRGLRPTHAELLRRVELDEQGLAEAAEALGISRGNAAVRLHRARHALRQGLLGFCRLCAEHGCLDCTCRPPARL